MSKNITTTAAALTEQGASQGTVTTAVSGITKGMGTVGANTTKSMIKVETVTSVVTEASTKLVEDCIKKEDIKMKLFVKLIFVANFLFLGGGFLIAFFQFIAYNGFGDIFEYVKPERLETYVRIDSIKETKTIFYKYVVDQKVYESKQSVYIPSIAECDFYENSVYYNKKIPFLSYVGTKELKLNSPESGMVVFGFFFLFIFLIYRYADMDKWIGVYTRGEYKSSRKK